MGTQESSWLLAWGEVRGCSQVSQGRSYSSCYQQRESLGWILAFWKEVPYRFCLRVLGHTFRHPTEASARVQGTLARWKLESSSTQVPRRKSSGLADEGWLRVLVRAAPSGPYITHSLTPLLFALTGRKFTPIAEKPTWWWYSPGGLCSI